MGELTLHTHCSLFLHTGHFHHSPSIYNTKMDGCSTSRFGLGGSSSLSVVSDPPTFDVLESPFISVTARRRDDVTRRWLHSCPPLHHQRKLPPALNSLKSYIHNFFFYTFYTHTEIRRCVQAAALSPSPRHQRHVHLLDSFAPPSLSPSPYPRLSPPSVGAGGPAVVGVGGGDGRRGRSVGGWRAAVH